jgi:hypothetical protein
VVTPAQPAQGAPNASSHRGSSLGFGLANGGPSAFHQDMMHQSLMARNQSSMGQHAMAFFAQSQRNFFAHQNRQVHLAALAGPRASGNSSGKRPRSIPVDVKVVRTADTRNQLLLPRRTSNGLKFPQSLSIESPRPLKSQLPIPNSAEVHLHVVRAGNLVFGVLPKHMCSIHTLSTCARAKGLLKSRLLNRDPASGVYSLIKVVSTYRTCPLRPCPLRPCPYSRQCTRSVWV